MLIYDCIKKKRNGGCFTKEELHFISESILNHSMSEAQIGSFLMACVLKGLDESETACLTEEMINSGVNLDFSDLPGMKIDKHSTGGVGDKVSLPLSAIIASFGIIVPMVSGRGLGHTGGTLDKLESIPGFSTEISVSRFREILKSNGTAIISQTKEFVPLDKKLYSIRDVTATVDDLALITASIMSKKLAEGIEGLVLDVKVGNGAFFKTLEEASIAAKAMISIGLKLKKKVTAVLTDMNQPLGRFVGNSLEVIESIEFLKGNYPEDLKEVVFELATEMLYLANQIKDKKDGFSKIEAKIASGEALDRFRKLICLQGGDARVTEDYSLFKKAPLKTDLLADKGGFIESFLTEKIGLLSVALGAGRKKPEDSIDPSVGFEFHKKLGEPCQKGEKLVTIYHKEPCKEIFEELKKAILIGEKKPELPKRIKLLFKGVGDAIEEFCP